MTGETALSGANIHEFAKQISQECEALFLRRVFR